MTNQYPCHLGKLQENIPSGIPSKEYIVYSNLSETIYQNLYLSYRRQLSKMPNCIFATFQEKQKIEYLVWEAPLF